MVSLLVVCCLTCTLLYLAQSRLARLRGIPGDKIAALTQGYRVYWDLIKGGRMVERLECLHEKYGSVVRIGPNEIHFVDPRAYWEIYSMQSRVRKDPGFYNAYSVVQSSIAFIDPVESKRRREILNPLFSKRSIIKLEHVIQAKIDRLVERLKTWDSRKPLRISDAIHSTSLDVISEYCFAQSFDTLSSPDFRHPILVSLLACISSLWLVVYLPYLACLSFLLPAWLVAILSPSSSGLVDLEFRLQQQVDRLLDNPELLELEDHETVYHHLLTAREVPSRSSLVQEASALVFGGSHTVGSTCTVGMSYVLSDERVRKTLVDELVNAWPEKDTPMEYARLEHLPYLTAVIKESLRMSHGVVSPGQRVVPEHTRIAGVDVPAWTAVSMGATFMHYNKDAFPDAYVFRPERWLESNARELDNYLVPFSRGPRMCLGINLAYCELYLIFANVFRKLEMRVHETTVEDMSQFRAYFVPERKPLHVLILGPRKN